MSDGGAGMSTSETTTKSHHPSWREVRNDFLVDPEVQASYQELAPCFAVVRQVIAHRQQPG